jgi:hypothetical protein
MSILPSLQGHNWSTSLQKWQNVFLINLMCIECVFGCKEFVIALGMHKLLIMDSKKKKGFFFQFCSQPRYQATHNSMIWGKTKEDMGNNVVGRFKHLELWKFSISLGGNWFPQFWRGMQWKNMYNWCMKDVLKFQLWLHLPLWQGHERPIQS